MTPQMENDLGFLVRIITLGVKGYLWFIGICILLFFLEIIMSPNKHTGEIKSNELYSDNNKSIVVPKTIIKIKPKYDFSNKKIGLM